ncbi:MAG: serine hydrolase [Bacteroidota bacterium]
MKKTLLTFVIIGVSTLSFCQTMCKGKVLNAADKTPIAFINIGIISSEVGTISNEDGSFSIRIPQKYADRQLIFSAVGYERKTIPVSQLSTDEPMVVYLQEKVTKLQNVNVYAKKIEKEDRWLGNGKRPILHQGSMNYDSATAGGAMALLIDRSNESDFQFIEKVNLLIARNTLPEFKVRLRFLEVDKENNGRPGDDLFNESIVVTSDLHDGWLEFDLTPYKYRMQTPSFYLMFEWIMEDKDRRYISAKYNEFMQLNPDKVIRDTVLVDNVLVPTVRVKNYILGTFFGTMARDSYREKYVTYDRGHSFDEWGRSANTLMAEVLMSNQPYEEKQKSNKPVNLKRELTRWGKYFRKKYALEGVQVSASSANKLVFSEGFGFADKENKKRVTKNTQFRIASVSKPITAAGMIKLAAEGKLNLEADIRNYVPLFPEKKYIVNSKQLASHLGGIRDYYEISLDEIFVQEHYNSLKEAISIFKDDPLEFEPGSQYLYSSYGYNLLGAAIEGASGQHYLDYMQDNVWKPLGMESTYGDISDSVMINKSKFYYFDGKEAKPYDLSYSYAAGGLISTTEDLVKFGNEMLHGSVFDQTMKNEQFQSASVDGQPTGYGLGWYLGEDIEGHKIWYHAGELPSSGSIIILYPDDDIVVALLTNSPIISSARNGLIYDIQKIARMIYSN